MKKQVALLMLFLCVLVGCSAGVNVKDGDYRLTDQDLGSIEHYLEKNLTAVSMDDGEIKCTFKVFGSNLSEGKIYIWATALELYDGGNQRTSGISVPVVVDVNQEDHQLQVISHSIPRDGSLYSRDLKKMFPKNIRDLIYDFDSEKQMNLLLEQY